VRRGGSDEHRAMNNQADSFARRLRRLTACTAAVLAAACATAAPDAKLRAVIGDAACDSDSQCRTVAIGAKACGGPQAYLAWSTKQTDAKAVARAAADYLSAEQANRLSDGRMSTCSVVVDPGASCVAQDGAGNCRLNAKRSADGGIAPPQR